MSLFRSLRRDEGASAVEFALVATLLIVLLLGIAQFGVTFFHYLEIVHSAREGARWASLAVDAGSVSDTDSVRGRVAAAAPGLNPALTDGQISISVNGTGSEQASVPADGGLPVTVTVTYDSPVFMPLLGSIVGGDTIHLTSAATLRVE